MGIPESYRFTLISLLSAFISAYPMNIILLLHRDGVIPTRVVTAEGEEISFTGGSCVDVFWDLAERFPHCLIGWCEEDLENKLQLENWPEVFHQKLIMASFSVNTKFLPEQIGYVDRFPFININREVLYGTWRMSYDVGGIYGETLSRFKDLFGHVKDFEYLLNSIGKLGQQNSLFCYSAPGLILHEKRMPLKSTASDAALFSFIGQHYSHFWLPVLFFCYLRFENKFPILPFLKALGIKKFFKGQIDLSGIAVHSSRDFSGSGCDVVIPTLGRAQYLLQVLRDLAVQTLPPTKVIIVEQQPEPRGETELLFLKEQDWPYEVVHHLIRQTGACNARNVALQEVTEDFVFFADDDIRLGPALIEDALKEMKKYGISCINLNCKQENDSTVFQKIKQWAAFGSGTSLVAAEFAKQNFFSMVYEHGFGEDLDYGMHLRNSGCDIIYHPDLEILHLKAPGGGFRNLQQQAWEEETEPAKPSPTLMAYVKEHYTEEQEKGYKLELFVRFYPKQGIRNPLNYVRTMKRRWKKSEELAESLLKKYSKIKVPNAV